MVLILDFFKKKKLLFNSVQKNIETILLIAIYKKNI